MRSLHRRYGHSSSHMFRVTWPGSGQIENYYPSANAAAWGRDSSIEYDRRHHQGGPHAVVQRYEGDGEWVTMRPQPKARGGK